MADIDYLKKLQQAMMGQDQDTMLEEIMPVDAMVASAEADQTPKITEAQINNVNEQAASPYMEPAPEVEPKLDAKAKYRELINAYEAKLNKKPETESGDTAMNWMTAAGQVANVMNRDEGIDDAPVQYWDDKIAKSKASKEKESKSGIQDLQKMYSNYMGLGKKKGQEMTDYQKKNLAIQKERLGLMTGKEGRLTKKDAFREEVKNRLSDKEVEAVNAFDDGARILDDIDHLLDTTDIKDDLGPYASRMEEVQKFIPGMERDTPFVKIQQLVGIQLADYVKSISGAQVSEEEAQRLLKNIPNMSDKPKSFKTKLDQFRSDLIDAKETYVKNIGKQKKGAEKFLKKEEAKPQEVRRKAKNGKTAIFDSKTKEFIRYE